MPPPRKTSPTSARRRVWRNFLLTLKWCRITVLLFLLVVLILGLFLNHVGLPDWLERRVEEQFRANGWEMKFSRLRLRWYHGIVAEDLQLQRTNNAAGPNLFLQAAEFRLNWKALRHLDLEANSVLLKNGRLLWPLPGTNQPQRTFNLTDAGGELIFKKGDAWELRYLEADILGTHVRFRGDITNASLIRDWKLPSAPARPDARPEDLWHRLLTGAEKIHFTHRPELNVLFSGDARDWKSFDATLKFMAASASSPWGSGTNLTLALQFLPPPASNDAVRIDLKLAAEHARTRWFEAGRLDLALVAEPSFTQLLPTNALASLELKDATGRWGQAERLLLELRSSPSPTNRALNATTFNLTLNNFTNSTIQSDYARVAAVSLHSVTNLLPAAITSAWTLHETRTSWLTSRWSRLTADLELPALAVLRSAQTNTAWEQRLQSIPVNLSATVSNLIAPALQLARAELNTRWHHPDLSFDLTSGTGSSSVDLRAALNTTNRATRFQISTTLEPRDLAPLLGTNAPPWLADFRFRAPPRLRAEGQVMLPSFTNRHPDWRGEVLPTLATAGQFEADGGSFRTVPYDSIRLPFAITNQAVAIPALKITRPEGALEVAADADSQTGTFTAKIRSDFNPLSLRAAFPMEEDGGIFDWLLLTSPPRLNARLGGNWHDLATLHGSADLALTNAAFRGQAIGSFTTRLEYTNRFLSILRPVVLRDGEQGRADGIGIDLALPRLYLTNATGRIATRAVTKSIGPMTDKAVEPFVFDLPPESKAEGSVPLGFTDGSENMTFEVNGGPFHWERFHLEHIQGTIVWRGNTLLITNVTGDWHGAKVAGAAYFEFPKIGGDIFSFHVRVDGADLRTVLGDLQPGRTNKVEGIVNGELFITRADTTDWKSWTGHGHARMTNGLLWEIPIFGVFSPIFNTVIPGLGNSRARQATTTYSITNSVIHTTDLNIRATAMRMRYKGSVDFEQHVNGTMEAELLRDLPVFGFLISKVLWPVTKIFEYSITGTLDAPKTEEQYFIPRVLLMPLQPLKTLKDLIEAGDKPPEKKPE